MVNIYAIYDKKSNMFCPVFDGRNDVVVQRDLLAHVMKNENHPYVAFSDDYELYCIGEMPDDKGVIVANASPRFVCSFTDLKDASKNQ